MNSLTFQNWDEYTLENNDGFLNESNYQTQESSQNKRKQLQSQISQTRDYLNNTVKPSVDTLQTHQIMSADENLLVTNDPVTNKTILQVVVSGSGEATKAYVDSQDSAKLLEAKTYSDANLVTAKAYADTQDNAIKNTTLDGKTVKALSESEYEALETKVATTLYFVYEDEV